MNRTTTTVTAGRVVFNAVQIEQKVQALCLAIIKEFQKDLGKLALVGIQTRGAHLARRMARQLHEETGKEINTGDRVKMKNNRQIGVVKEIRGKKAIIQIGIMPITVNLADLVAVKEKV